MENGIRLARPGDIPALCELWKACFPDSDDYIRSFYRENFARITVPVFSVNGKPVSMLHLLDSAFANGREQRPAKLIYAAGTHPDFRKTGCMGALLEEAVKKAAQEDCILFLKPADRSLVGYYRAFGFVPDTSLRVVTVLPGEQAKLSVSPLSPEEYNRLRNAAFSGRPYVKWPDAHLRWCVEENELFGGETLTVRWNNEEHFLMGSPEQDVFWITETDMTIAQLKQVSGALCERFGANALKVCLPEDSCEEGETTVPCVVFHASPRGTYVNLILI